jgi:hypothetical protein
LASLSSLRSLLYKYFQRNQTKNSLNQKESLSPNEQPLIKHDVTIIRRNSNEYHRIIHHKRRVTAVVQGIKTNTSIKKTLSVPNRRLSRQTTTATFTGQKRCLNEVIEDNRYQNDLIINTEEEEQLIRARLSTRTSSLPAARCISYYYYQHKNPSKTITTKAIIEDQHRDIVNGHHCQLNSLTPERSRSQSHSSAQCLENGRIATPDTDHSSSFDNGLDEEQRRLNRRTQQSHGSTSYNSSRYSQHAITQFLHERHQARLRRNQKASRMLGKI